VRQSALSADQIRQLQALRAAINPRQLHRSIETLITQLFALPLAQEGMTEGVRQTIGLWQASQIPHQSG